MYILFDSKEKQPWDFSFAEDCIGQERKHLITGDYTLQGYETKIIIERKKSVDEIAGNLGSKYKQFEAEMKRMKDYECCYVVCEFPLSDIINYPNSSRLSAKLRAQLRLSSKFLLKRINEVIDNYSVNFIYTNSREEAEQIVLDIFRQIINEKN